MCLCDSSLKVRAEKKVHTRKYKYEAYVIGNSLGLKTTHTSRFFFRRRRAIKRSRDEKKKQLSNYFEIKAQHKTETGRSTHK